MSPSSSKFKTKYTFDDCFDTFLSSKILGYTNQERLARSLSRQCIMNDSPLVDKIMSYATATISEHTSVAVDSRK